NSTTSLNVSATLPATPTQSAGKRTEKSPFFKAVRAVSMEVVSNACSPGSIATGCFSARIGKPSYGKVLCFWPGGAADLVQSKGEKLRAETRARKSPARWEPQVYSDTKGLS